MKRKLFLLLIPTLLFGCTTTDQSQNQLNISRTAAIVRTSSQLGVYYAVKQDAELVPWFTAAHLAITILIDEQRLTPEQVRAALLRIDPGAAREDVMVPIMAALEVYDVFWGDVARQKLNEVDYLVPVLTALRDGIALGLNVQATRSMHRIGK